ncbi:hypothetical protein SCHPADRAFT_358540 [Schizopora paradoxa]|uniref:DUF6533 domain-containing protein n=1 Tax=Schizopora paradoxa TaxID=27342 RepID=A0A0H2RNI2_9AGAM|nr:hypothetical protein SCHPADRAFT_358540 [Schizopora paradoxa]
MADSLDFLKDVLKDEFNVKCMYISNAALLTYDTIINYPDEVQYIWKSSFSLGKCLYVMSRYLAFVDVFLHLRLSFDSSLDPSRCRATYNVIPWTITAGVVIAEAILIARTFAIYSRSCKILAYLVCIRLGTLIPSMKLINDWTHGMQFSESPAPTLAPCVPMPDDGVKIWLDFLFIAIFDCNIVVLTLWKALSQWKRGLTRHRLVSTLYRDGIGYFVALCIVTVSDPVTATDPLVFGAATDASELGSRGRWRTDSRSGGMVIVRTDTHWHVDSESVEMNRAPNGKFDT